MRYWHIYHAGKGQGHLRSKFILLHETVHTFLSSYIAIIGCKKLPSMEIYAIINIESTFQSHPRSKVMISNEKDHTWFTISVSCKLYVYLVMNLCLTSCSLALRLATQQHIVLRFTWGSWPLYTKWVFSFTGSIGRIKSVWSYPIC